MMTCERARDQIRERMIGSVAPAVRRDLDTHLNQCPACAGEAAAMGRLTDQLQSGLGAWVDAGEAPPGLEQQLRLAVRSAAAVDVAEVLREAEATPAEWQRRQQGRRQEHRRTYWTVAAAAAVAGLLFISLPGGQQVVTQIPLVGALVQFFQGGEPAAEPGAVAMDRTAVSGGVTLRVTAMTVTADATLVTYQLEGLPGGLAGRDARDLAGELLAGGRRLQLVSLAVVPDSAGAPRAVAATYGPVLAGEPPRFRVERLPGVAGGPWEVELPVR